MEQRACVNWKQRINAEFVNCNSFNALPVYCFCSKHTLFSKNCQFCTKFKLIALRCCFSMWKLCSDFDFMVRKTYKFSIFEIMHFKVRNVSKNWWSQDSAIFATVNRKLFNFQVNIVPMQLGWQSISHQISWHNVIHRNIAF